jgi:bifunctional isochorismate lyase/aryl carrier protein
MKEQYFTEDSIQILSEEWIDRYSSPRKALRQPFTIENAALLILDMQRYFLEPESHAFVPSGLAIIENLNRISAEFYGRGRPVIATQHINTPEDAGQMAAWWSELITREHPLAGLHPGLEIEAEDILPKPQYDAFYKSSLSERLKENQVKQVVIGGVMAHLCCETTARSAFNRGYEVFFLVDGTATYNSEFHQASLLNLAHGIALLVRTEQLLEEK